VFCFCDDVIAVAVVGGLTFATLEAGGTHTCGVTTEGPTSAKEGRWGVSFTRAPLVGQWGTEITRG
jgi:hypothetical protein